MQALITKIQDEIVNPAITVLALVAFIIFAWGVAEYVLGAADPGKRKTGQQHMLWGIIGLTIIFGAKVIVTILENIVGVPNSSL
jgi:hypothetical protein